MKPNLLECPFCGGQASIVNRDVEPQGDTWYGNKREDFVLCQCGACLFDGSFHEGFYDAAIRALTAWNNRPTEQLLRAKLQIAIDALEQIAKDFAGPDSCVSVDAELALDKIRA